MHSELDVRVAREGTHTTVVVTGDIDLISSVRLNRDLDDVFETAPQWLRMDLSQVGYMDTAGVAVLLKARRRALETGCRFTVKAASPTIERLLAITGLTALLAE